MMPPGNFIYTREHKDKFEYVWTRVNRAQTIRVTHCKPWGKPVIKYMITRRTKVKDLVNADEVDISDHWMGIDV